MPRIKGRAVAPKPRKKHNASLFLRLPVEILTTQILGYFPDVPVGVPRELRVNCKEPLLPDVVLERSKVLRALAQTCWKLRNICLPLQWEQLNLCSYPHGKEGYCRNRYLSRMTERVCNAMYLSLEQSSYIRTINVALTRYYPHTVLPALACYMETLPNLHTLQITHAHGQTSTFIKDSFEQFTFPQIRTVILPSEAHNILLCCPGARRVVCNTEVDSQKLIAPIIKSCKNVERIEGLSGLSMAVFKRLVKNVPNLKYIGLQLNHDTTEEQIMVLAGLTQLTELNLRVQYKDADATMVDHRNLIQAAKKVVSQLPTHTKCVLKVGCDMDVEVYKWHYRKEAPWEMNSPRWIRTIETGRGAYSMLSGS